MSSPSPDIVVNRPIGITALQLAGGEPFDGIHAEIEYKSTSHGREETKRGKVKDLTERTNSTVKMEDRECRATCIVLGILAVLAAGGGATLIAFSGGPSNLQLFVPGVLLGAATALLSTWFVVVIVRSKRFRNKHEGEVTDLTAYIVPNNVALQAMLNPEVSPGQIRNAMREFTPEQCHDYIGWVNDQFASDGDGPLGAAQIKVLGAFAAFPEVVTGHDNLEGPFVLEMIKPKENAQLFARKPMVVAELAQKMEPAADGASEKTPFIPKENIGEIYSLMTPKEQYTFLDQMYTHYCALRAPAEDVENPPPTTEVEQQALAECVGLCIDKTLTADFAAICDPTLVAADAAPVVAGGEGDRPVVVEGEDNARPVESVENIANREKIAAERRKQRKLLLQIAKWPTQAAHRLMFYPGDTRIRDIYLIKMLEAIMSPEQQAQYIDYAVEQLKKSDHVIKFVNDWIGEHSRTPSASPMIQQIFAKLPDATARAVGSTEQQARPYLEQIFHLMTPNDKIEFLKRDKDSNEALFINKLLREGMEKQAREEAQKKERSAMPLFVAYFTAYPVDFKQVIIENEELGNKEKRLSLAIHILEDMDKGAEAVIDKLDVPVVAGFGLNVPNMVQGVVDFFTGPENYNALMEKLNHEVKDLDLTKQGKSRSRVKLMARLLPLHSKFGAVNTSGKEWKNFRELAQRGSKFL